MKGFTSLPLGAPKEFSPFGEKEKNNPHRPQDDETMGGSASTLEHPSGCGKKDCVEPRKPY